MSNIKSGTLVKVNSKSISPDGLIMLGINDTGNVCIHEKINLDSYPSSNDFFGNTISIDSLGLGLVVKKLGRPYKIRQDAKFSHYDVYEIVIKDKIYNVFRYNLDVDH